MNRIYVRAAISSPWLFTVGDLIHQTFLRYQKCTYLVLLNLFLDGAIHRGVVGFPLPKVYPYSLGEYYRLYLWTPKPWKMKVLHPQNMGYNPQKSKMKVLGSHGSWLCWQLLPLEPAVLSGYQHCQRVPKIFSRASVHLLGCSPEVSKRLGSVAYNPNICHL